MANDPVDLIGGLADSGNVSKSDFRAYEKARNPGVFTTVDEVRNTTLSGRTHILIAGRIYQKNTEATDEDNGGSVIVDGDGVCWFRMAEGLNPRGNYSAVATYQIGDVVTYNESSYLCIVEDTSATAPTPVSPNWQVLAMAGSPGGPITIPYTFSTTTTDSDPGDGGLRLDNATQNAATTIRADLLDNLGNSWAGVIDSFDASTSAIKGFVRLQHQFDDEKWLIGAVSAVAEPSGYRNISITIIGYSSASPLANDDPILLLFTRNGDKGEPGTNATIAVGSTTTVAPGEPAAVTNSGTSSAAIFDFEIPEGEKGDKGDTGDAATVSVGSTTTGAPGSGASVTNSGTSHAAVLNFTIPRGAKGDGLDYDLGPVADNTARDALVGVTVGQRVAVSDSGDGRSAIYELVSSGPYVWSDPLYVTGSGGGSAETDGVDTLFIISSL